MENVFKKKHSWNGKQKYNQLTNNEYKEEGDQGDKNMDCCNNYNDDDDNHIKDNDSDDDGDNEGSYHLKQKKRMRLM